MEENTPHTTYHHGLSEQQIESQVIRSEQSRQKVSTGAVHIMRYGASYKLDSVLNLLQIDLRPMPERVNYGSKRIVLS